MIVNIDLSQEIFAIDMSNALNSSLKHVASMFCDPYNYMKTRLLFNFADRSHTVIKKILIWKHTFFSSHMIISKLSLDARVVMTSAGPSRFFFVSKWHVKVQARMKVIENVMKG